MALPTMQEGFRWFGPNDPVTLAGIRQTGASSIFSALHEIPYGECWPRANIRKHKDAIQAAGMKWAAVESLPVSEDIKSRTDDYAKHIENYRNTLQHLGDEDIRIVIYNFMPVLDWVRTDLQFVLEDGAKCLCFTQHRFAAFDIFVLQRDGAEADYTPQQLADAAAFWEGLDETRRRSFTQSLIDVFPGCKLGLRIADIQRLIGRYDGMDAAGLREHHRLFLQEVLPAAEDAGVRLAIHPDDPPFPLMGLPRIVSTERDLAEILAISDSAHNGLCFCSGSLGARADNDLPRMIERFADRIHALHLRSVERMEDGDFYEANHLGGSVDMCAVVCALLREQDRRKQEGCTDWQLLFRPDHGHTMMDDLSKPPVPNPGYTGIGRMRGLAELRGLQLGIARSMDQRTSGA